jgi:hypothetical protein
MILKMAACLFLMTRWQCLVIFQMAALLFILNVMLMQYGGSLVLEGNMAHRFQNGRITFPFRADGSMVPR